MSVGPLDRESENLPTVPLSESTLQFAAKTRKKSNESCPKRKAKYDGGKKCPSVRRKTGNESFPCPFKLPILSFLTSFLSPLLQSKPINDDDDEEKEKKKARK